MNKKLPWDIIILKLRGNLSEEDSKSFVQWLNKADNAILFQQLEIVWNNIQRKVENYEPDMEYYWKELSARMDNNRNSIPAAKSKYFTFKPFYKYVAAASILLIISLSSLYYFGYLRTDNSIISQSYTSLNGKSKVLLPDSSEVWLHSNTTLTYSYSNESKLREVALKGEAYFNIKAVWPLHNREKRINYSSRIKIYVKYVSICLNGIL